MCISEIYLQRLAEQCCCKSIVIVLDNARSPPASATRNKRSQPRPPRRWNSNDGLAKVIYGNRRRGLRREKTYPTSRWEPACKDKVPCIPPVSLRSFSNTKLMADFAMKLPSRCSDSPTRREKSTVELIDDVLAELHILEDNSISHDPCQALY
jgi:hypothetical protein